MKETALSKDDLLMRRYEVIAPYPYSPYKVGDLLTFNSGFWHIIDIDDETSAMHKSEYVDMFPNLFKPLAWHEKRDWSDFPQYIKMRDGKVKKVLPAECDNQTFHQPDTIELRFLKVDYMMNGSEPATELEYMDYLKSPF